MPTFRPDVSMVEKVVKNSAGAVLGVELGSSGSSIPEANESKVQCPKCGSPYLAAFDESEERFSKEIPGFACVAGDCAKIHGAANVASRSPN